MGLKNVVQGAVDLLFGPPKVKTLPDGSLRVKLMGRVHTARSYDELFGSVNRERERLISSVAKSREGLPVRAGTAFSRIGPGDLHHRDIQRLEDRLAIYNHFLGHLVRVMQRTAEPT